MWQTAVATEQYEAVCPRCGYRTGSLDVSGIEDAVERVQRLASCAGCRIVCSVSMPPRRAELTEYRRQVERAIRCIRQAQRNYLANLHRRIQALEPRVAGGQATLAERARLTRALEAQRATGAGQSAPVAALEETLKRIVQAMAFASDEPVYHACGQPLEIHAETPAGYKIACPHCGEGLVVRLVRREISGQGDKATR